jgi:hypothetical protein
VADNDSLYRVVAIVIHLLNTLLLLAALALTAWWASGGARPRLRGQAAAGWALGIGLLGMLAVGWGIGWRVGRVRTQLASRDLGRTVTDGWFNLVRTYRPGAQLSTNGQLPARRRQGDVGRTIMAQRKAGRRQPPPRPRSSRRSEHPSRHDLARRGVHRCRPGE